MGNVIVPFLFVDIDEEIGYYNKMLKIYKDKTYRLTKISIKEDHYSSIPVGYSQEGEGSLMTRRGKTWVYIQGKSWNDCLSTSPIKSIIRHIKGYELQTETSTYLLEAIDEEANKKSNKSK